MTKSNRGMRTLVSVMVVTLLAFLCISIPKMAFADGGADPFEQAVEVDLVDGEYSIGAVLGGGTGKATIESPALLTVKNHRAVATIRWSSSNYDYMLVNGVKYLDQNKDSEKGSLFQIPVLSFDGPFAVVGDTTAMSTAHEVDYDLEFDLKSVVAGAPEAYKAKESGSAASASRASASASSSSNASSGDVTGMVIMAVIFIVVLGVGIAIGVVKGRKSREL